MPSSEKGDDAQHQGRRNTEEFFLGLSIPTVEMNKRMDVCVARAQARATQLLERIGQENGWLFYKKKKKKKKKKRHFDKPSGSPFCGTIKTDLENVI